MAETSNRPQTTGGNYRDLQAWQVAMELAESVYRATSQLSSEDEFTLGVQSRRSALSIPSNIAEGYCRRSPGARLNHLLIAAGSHGELETQLELAARTGIIDAATHASIKVVCDHAGRLLTGLIRANRRRATRGSGG